MLRVVFYSIVAFIIGAHCGVAILHLYNTDAVFFLENDWFIFPAVGQGCNAPLPRAQLYLGRLGWLMLNSTTTFVKMTRELVHARSWRSISDVIVCTLDLQKDMVKIMVDLLTFMFTDGYYYLPPLECRCTAQKGACFYVAV